MALFVAVYVCAYIGACVASALTSINILFITSQVLRWGGIVLIFCIITTYQQDIKSSITRFARWHDSKDTYDYGNSEDDLRQAVDEIVKGCQTLSKNDTGALIVITPSVVPSHLLETGTMLNAKISDGLLQCIFNTKAPLHVVQLS